MDRRLEEWDRWLETIQKDIEYLLIKREIFWGVQEIIRNNERIQRPNTFNEFLAINYSDSAVMCVRRQAKINKDSISLARLLKEIIDEPQLVSNNRHLSLSEENLSNDKQSDIANKEFERFAGRRGDYIDPELVKTDLETLKNIAKECIEYADRKVAHLDKRGLASKPTFADLDRCIDTLEEIYMKYHLTFKAEALLQLKPVFQFDWKEVFKEPWLKLE